MKKYRTYCSSMYGHDALLGGLANRSVLGNSDRRSCDQVVEQLIKHHENVT